jgi:hypothetical protein
MERYRAYLDIKHGKGSGVSKTPWPANGTAVPAMTTSNACAVAPSFGALANLATRDPATFPVAVVDGAFMDFSLQVRTVEVSSCADDDDSDGYGNGEDECDVTYDLTAVLTFTNTGLGFSPMSGFGGSAGQGSVPTPAQAAAWLEQNLATRPLDGFGVGCGHMVWAPAGLSTLAWHATAGADDDDEFPSENLSHSPQLEAGKVTVRVVAQPELPQDKFTAVPTFVEFKVVKVPLEWVVTLKLPARVAHTNAETSMRDLLPTRIEVTPLYLVAFLGRETGTHPSWFHDTWEIIRGEVQQCVAVHHALLTRAEALARASTDVGAGVGADADTDTDEDGGGGGGGGGGAGRGPTKTTPHPRKPRRPAAAQGTLQDLVPTVRREIWAALGVCTHGVDNSPMYNGVFGDIQTPVQGFAGIDIGVGAADEFRVVGEPVVTPAMRAASAAKALILEQVANVLEKTAQNVSEQAKTAAVLRAQAKQRDAERIVESSITSVARTVVLQHRRTSVSTAGVAQELITKGLGQLASFGREAAAAAADAAVEVIDLCFDDEEQGEDLQTSPPLRHDNNYNYDDDEVIVLSEDEVFEPSDDDDAVHADASGDGGGGGGGGSASAPVPAPVPAGPRASASASAGAPALVNAIPDFAGLFPTSFADIAKPGFSLDVAPFDANIFGYPCTREHIWSRKMAAWVTHHLFRAMQRRGCAAEAMWTHCVCDPDQTAPADNPLTAFKALLGAITTGVHHFKVAAQVANAPTANFVWVQNATTEFPPVSGSRTAIERVGRLHVEHLDLGPFEFVAFRVKVTVAYGWLHSSPKPPVLSWMQTGGGKSKKPREVPLQVVMVVSDRGLYQFNASSEAMEVVTTKWAGPHSWCTNPDGLAPPVLNVRNWPSASDLICVARNPEFKRGV